MSQISVSFLIPAANTFYLSNFNEETASDFEYGDTFSVMSYLAVSCVPLVENCDMEFGFYCI